MLIEPLISKKTKIKHIELAAGGGKFGQNNHFECFLTDKETSTDLIKIHGDCFIDFSCSAYEIPSGDDRFQKIIICNPYYFGFLDKDDSFDLLDEFFRILENNGSIIIVSSNRNQYANSTIITKRIEQYREEKNKNFAISIIKNIDPDLDYPSDKFTCCNGNKAHPNFQIEITCLKDA